MYLMKNFQKGGGMDEVLKFVTLDGGLRKKQKKKKKKRKTCTK